MLSPLARLALGAALAALPGCSGETCGQCMSEKCPDQEALCAEDADCACVADCIGGKGIPAIDQCLSSCSLTERPTRYYALEMCVATACPDAADECGSKGKNPGTDGFPPDTSVGGSDTDTTGGGTSTGGESSTGGAGGTGGTGDTGHEPGDLPDCSFDMTLAFDPEGEVVQLESADKNVCVRLDRRDEGYNGEETIYTLLSLRAGELGAVSLIEAPEDLCYYTSHHNFQDLAHGWTGTRHYDVSVREKGHGGERTYFLYTWEQGPITSCGVELTQAEPDGTNQIGPTIELFPVNP